MAKHAMRLKILPSLVRYNDVTGQKVGPDDVWGHVSMLAVFAFTLRQLPCAY